MTTKFCKDCKFFDADLIIFDCRFPPELLDEKSPVTNTYYEKDYQGRASFARSSQDPRECGPEARHFQPSLTYRVVNFFKRGIQ